MDFERLDDQSLSIVLLDSNVKNDSQADIVNPYPDDPEFNPAFLLISDSQNKEQKCNCLSDCNCSNEFYDVINIIITVLDLITDILVMIEFYNAGRMAFFILALIFVLVANICYTMAFIIKFADSSRAPNPCVLFCCLLPISPFMPYILYCASLPDNFCSKEIFPQFGFTKDEAGDKCWDNEISYQEWAEAKFKTNMGFIIEGLIQSFPEAMIQVIAIVYYKEYNNYISLLSILLSLLSVCIKSLILSEGMNRVLRLFKWLCAVTDFFAIFVMISWAFYNYNDNIDSSSNNNPDIVGLFNVESISWIGYFWIYKVLFLTFPVSVSIAMIFVARYLFESWQEQYESNDGSKLKRWIVVFPFFVFLIFVVAGMY